MAHSRKNIGKNRNLRKISRKGGALFGLKKPKILSRITPRNPFRTVTVEKEKKPTIPTIVDWTTDPNKPQNDNYTIVSILKQLKRNSMNSDSTEGTELKQIMFQDKLDYSLKYYQYNRREIRNNECPPLIVEFSKILEKKTKPWAPVFLVFIKSDIEDAFTIIDDKYVCFNINGKKFGSPPKDNFDVQSYYIDDMNVTGKPGSTNEREVLETHLRGFILLTHILHETYNYNDQKEIPEIKEFEKFNTTVLGYTPACMGSHAKLRVIIGENKYVMLLPAIQGHLGMQKTEMGEDLVVNGNKFPVLMYKLGPGGSVDHGIKETLMAEFFEETGINLDAKYISDDLNSSRSVDISVKGQDGIGGGHNNTANEHPVNITTTRFIDIKFETEKEMREVFKKRTDVQEAKGLYLIPVQNFFKQVENTEKKTITFNNVIKIGNPDGVPLQNDVYKDGILTLSTAPTYNKINTKKKPLFPCSHITDTLKNKNDENYFLESVRDKPKFTIKSKCNDIEGKTDINTNIITPGDGTVVSNLYSSMVTQVKNKTNQLEDFKKIIREATPVNPASESGEATPVIVSDIIGGNKKTKLRRSTRRPTKRRATKRRR